jgi:hypothetical protein
MSRVIHRCSDPRDKSRGYSNLTPSEFGCVLYDVHLNFAPAFKLVNTISKQIPALAINSFLINISFSGS